MDLPVQSIGENKLQPSPDKDCSVNLRSKERPGDGLANTSNHVLHHPTVECTRRTADESQSETLAAKAAKMTTSDVGSVPASCLPRSTVGVQLESGALVSCPRFAHQELELEWRIITGPNL